MDVHMDTAVAAMAAATDITAVQTTTAVKTVRAGLATIQMNVVTDTIVTREGANCIVQPHTADMAKRVVMDTIATATCANIARLRIADMVKPAAMVIIVMATCANNARLIIVDMVKLAAMDITVMATRAAGLDRPSLVPEL
ncbi:unnamed protein product [Agarophyton chilense]